MIVGYPMPNGAYVFDPHSHFNPEGPVMNSLEWYVRKVDFKERMLHATATITFDAPGFVHLDAAGLAIESVRSVGGRRIDYSLDLDAPDVAVRGQRLTFAVPTDRTVSIKYCTNPDPTVCTGLQWLEAEQTSDKFGPMVYSQGQAINARTYVPCQDSPQVRFTVAMHIVVPKGMVALSGGTFTSGTHGDCDIILDVPIPAYLLTLNVGHFVFRDITKTMTRVWAEPSVVERAADTFQVVPKFIAAARAMFGEYPWGRFDPFVPPWTFPYGGMENPCLPSISPTAISPEGTIVVAHELAHAWFGNLITNARWCDFWLNEGWTTWAEIMITRRVYGPKIANLRWALAGNEYRRALEKVAGNPELEKLSPNIAGAHPDAVYSYIQYYKGAALLFAIMDEVGESRFMAFARRYIEVFKFKSITTEQFLAFLQKEMPMVDEWVNARAWIYEGGMPPRDLKMPSVLATEAENKASTEDLPMRDWHASQLVLYLESASRSCSEAFVQRITQLKYYEHKDFEIRWAYFMFMIERGLLFRPQYAFLLGHLEQYLCTVGRMKYILSLYKALTQSAAGDTFARSVFGAVGTTYHPQAHARVTELLAA